MVMPIACSHPSGSSFRRFAKSWLIDGDGAIAGVLAHAPLPHPLPAGERASIKKDEGPANRPSVVDVRSASASDSRSRIRMETLEAHVLPSSRLANEAAGTTIRFIQASASPPLPRGQ